MRRTRLNSCWTLSVLLTATCWASDSDRSVSSVLCTSAVASGIVTVDGRPLLWKNRDTSRRDNEIVHFAATDGAFAFVAVCNAGQTSAVWGGLNDHGFAVINTLTPDLRSLGTRSAKGLANGSLMKRALETCATVDEFEQLLLRTNEAGRRTIATFSVIDAQGGAATFETGPGAFVRFDADSRAAASTLTRGLNIRSNFTYTAHDLAPETVTAQSVRALDGVGSKRRYDRAAELCLPLAAGSTLNVSALLGSVIRDQQLDPEETPLLNTRDTLSRRTSVSAMVFHGAKPGEDPLTATMWVVLGEPALSVAVPVWVAAGGTSKLVDGPKTSPISDAAQQVRGVLYEDTTEGPRLDTSKRDALQVRTLALETRMLRSIESNLERWRTKGVEPTEMRAAHDSACGAVLDLLTAWLDEQP